MCERMKPRLDRERKEYDLNQVQIWLSKKN